MKSNSEKVKTWRRKTKERMLAAMGGCCQVCGYDKCNDSLAFHHIDPTKKDFTFSKVRANPTSWVKIVSELKKCILVCHNCHSEIHAGVSSIPDKYFFFDEKYLDYKNIDKEKQLDNCPQCGKLKHNVLTYCSRKCSGKSSRKVDWDNINILEEYRNLGSLTKISEKYNISDQAVRKRMKILGITLKGMKSLINVL